MKYLLPWLGSMLLAIGCMEPVAAEVRDRSASGFTIENSQWVPVKPPVAWRALLEVGHWWPADHTWWGKSANLSIEPVAGGCFCEIDGERQARHLVVVFVEPGKLLRMQGGLGPLQGMGLDGVLEVRLVPEEDGTRITMWYRAGGYAPDDLAKLAPVVDRVQASQLLDLADYIRSAAAPPPAAQKLMNSPPLTGTLAPVR